MRKHKDLNAEYFDNSSLSMTFHFLASNNGVRTACALSFLFILFPAFFEHYLSIVGVGYGENPTSKSNSLHLKVTAVRALLGFRLTKEFLSNNHFASFRDRRADGHLMEPFLEAQYFVPNDSNE
jgi:hypothetical protein